MAVHCPYLWNMYTQKRNEKWNIVFEVKTAYCLQLNETYIHDRKLRAINSMGHENELTYLMTMTIIIW